MDYCCARARYVLKHERPLTTDNKLSICSMFDKLWWHSVQRMYRGVTASENRYLLDASSNTIVLVFSLTACVCYLYSIVCLYSACQYSLLVLF